MFYLMREKRARIGSTVWFKGRTGRLVYRVKEYARCVLHGSDVMYDHLGWRMTIVRAGKA